MMGPSVIKALTLAILMQGIVCSPFLFAESRVLESLGDLRWKNRIILVDEAADRTVLELVARAPEFEERHLVWFCVVGEGIRTNYDGALAKGLSTHLRQAYFDASGFPVLLIGKDGGIKSRNQALDIDAYLMNVDGMPMRQREMKAPSLD